MGEKEVGAWRRWYLACLRTVRVKLDLLGSKFTSCVHIIAQIDPAKGTLAQEFPPAPIDGGTRSYRKNSRNCITIHTLIRDPSHSPDAGSWGLWLRLHPHLAPSILTVQPLYPTWSRLSTLVNGTLRSEAWEAEDS